MMTPDNMCAVIQAYKEGKVIQFRDNRYPSYKWKDCSLDGPAWNFDANDYRVKPAPREFKVKTINEDGVDGLRIVIDDQHFAVFSNGKHIWRGEGEITEAHIGSYTTFTIEDK